MRTDVAPVVGFVSIPAVSAMKIGLLETVAKSANDSPKTDENVGASVVDRQ